MYFSKKSATTSENAENGKYALTASSEPHFPTKKQLDNFKRDLNLAKSEAELLRLNE